MEDGIGKQRDDILIDRSSVQVLFADQIVPTGDDQAFICRQGDQKTKVCQHGLGNTPGQGAGDLVRIRLSSQ